MAAQTKKPILLRILFCVITLATFAYVMFPITERDFMEVLHEKIDFSKVDTPMQNVLKSTQEHLEKEPTLYASNIILENADKYNVNLADYIIPIPEVQTTKDVISIVKRDCATAIRLGIDLRGGVEFLVTLEDIPAEDGGTEEMHALSFNEKADRARELVRTRLEKLGIYEAEITDQAGKYLSIRVPVTSREEKSNVRQLITAAAKLKFRIVSDNSDAEVEKYLQSPENYEAPAGTEMMKMVESVRNGKVTSSHVLVNQKTEMTGNDINRADVVRDPQTGALQISFKFNTRGAEEFGRVTTSNKGKRLAIVLDGQLYSAPVINDRITSQGVISGSFSREEAESVANALSSGNLPFKMKVAGEFDVDPTLGKENVSSGMWAAFASLIVVMVFMGIYYMKSGWVANVALVANVVMILGALAAFQQTLTLPGIAGVILTIGMAVDANVLINERIREELVQGKSIFHAIENGYNRAFLTIFDSNITTLLVGLILIWIATGAVKGFAIVLSIGIVTSMFSALMLTRVIFDILARFDRPKSLPMLSFGGLGTVHTFDFLKVRKIAVLISIVMIIVSFATFAVRGSSAFSIDFRGGTQIAYSYNTADHIPDQKIIDALTVAGFEGIKATYKKSSNSNFLELIIAEQQPKAEELVQANHGVVPAVTAVIVKDFPSLLVKEKDGTTIADDVKEIGGLVGASFALSAFLAIFIACVGILLYVTLRFEAVYAASATVALIHDVIVSTGIFLLLGGEISLTVVAAILTVYGYSLNDTIVVFDRIREQYKLYPEKPFRAIINDSINSTLSRTILTSVTVLITVMVLLLFGGIAIRDFALVMLIGLVIGTYSSIYIASPVAYWWYKSFGIKHDKHIEDPIGVVE